MRPEDRRRASLDFGLIFESLWISISEAGGIPRNIGGLNNISAFDLLCELGANNIRFTYTPGTGDCDPAKSRL